MGSAKEELDMEMTLGERIAMLRRQKNLTQEELAAEFGLSAQAVSKWERGESCPDIMLLPQLAKRLGVTVDALLTGEMPQETYLAQGGQRKPVEQLILKIRVTDGPKTRANINVPLMLVRMLSEMNDGQASVHLGNSDVFEHIDMEMLMRLVDSGVMGKLIEIDDDDAHVEVFVE